MYFDKKKKKNIWTKGIVELASGFKRAELREMQPYKSFQVIAIIKVSEPQMG